MVDQVDELLLKHGRCEKGDVVVITAGSPPGVSGATKQVSRPAAVGIGRVAERHRGLPESTVH